MKTKKKKKNSFDLVHNFQLFLKHFWSKKNKRCATSWSDILYSWVFCAILSFWVKGRLCILQLLTVLDLAKNLVGLIAEYAVDDNLFRLGSQKLWKKKMWTKKNFENFSTFKKKSYVVSELARFARGRIEDSNFNRFASTAYFAKPGFVGVEFSGGKQPGWNLPGGIFRGGNCRSPKIFLFRREKTEKKRYGNHEKFIFLFRVRFPQILFGFDKIY